MAEPNFFKKLLKGITPNEEQKREFLEGRELSERFFEVYEKEGYFKAKQLLEEQKAIEEGASPEELAAMADKNDKAIMPKIEKFIKNQRLDALLNDRFKISTYNDTSEEVGVMNYCIENEIELIALGTHGRKGIWKVFNESTSQNLVNHSFRPVLTIKIKD